MKVKVLGTPIEVLPVTYSRGINMSKELDRGLRRIRKSYAGIDV